MTDAEGAERGRAKFQIPLGRALPLPPPPWPQEEAGRSRASGRGCPRPSP